MAQAGKSIKALPPLRKIPSLDQMKRLDSIGSNASPLDSPKSQQFNSTDKQKYPEKSIIKRRIRGNEGSLDKDESKSSASADLNSRAGPSKIIYFAGCYICCWHFIVQDICEHPMQLQEFKLFIVGKRLSFSKELEVSRSQGSSEFDGSPVQNIDIKKGILRSSPSKSSRMGNNKSLRAALIEKDEKRIQFDIDNNEKLELQVSFANLCFTYYQITCCL